MIEQTFAAAQQGEPVLMNAIAVGAGALVLWMAHTVLKVRDAVLSIKTALWGDPDTKEDHPGLVGEIHIMRVEVKDVGMEVTEHTREEMSWRDANGRIVNTHNNSFQRTLNRIERKLGITEEEVC